MKLQLTILLIFALFLCDLLVSAESEKTSEMMGRKKFNRQNKMIRKPEDAQKGEKRSRFPHRLSHGNGGFRTTNRMAMNRPGRVGK